MTPIEKIESHMENYVNWKQMYTILITCVSLWMTTIVIGIGGFWGYMAAHTSQPHAGVVKTTELQRIDDRFNRMEMKIEGTNNKIDLTSREVLNKVDALKNQVMSIIAAEKYKDATK